MGTFTLTLWQIIKTIVHSFETIDIKLLFLRLLHSVSVGHFLFINIFKHFWLVCLCYRIAQEHPHPRDSLSMLTSGLLLLLLSIFAASNLAVKFDWVRTSFSFKSASDCFADFNCGLLTLLCGCCCCCSLAVTVFGIVDVVTVVVSSADVLFGISSDFSDFSDRS